MPAVINNENRTVPDSSGETDIETSELNNPDHSARDIKARKTEPETEQEDDPMDSQPLVKQRPKRPPKPVLEEEEEEVQQEVRDNTTVPETEDEVPLATVVKTTKAAPKSLPPRGRSMRNKRPIIYTESPDTSDNEVSTAKFRFTFVILICPRRRKRRQKRLPSSVPPRRGESKSWIKSRRTSPPLQLAVEEEGSRSSLRPPELSRQPPRVLLRKRNPRGDGGEERSHPRKQVMRVLPGGAPLPPRTMRLRQSLPRRTKKPVPNLPTTYHW